MLSSSRSVRTALILVIAAILPVSSGQTSTSPDKIFLNDDFDAGIEAAPWPEPSEAAFDQDNTWDDIEALLAELPANESREPPLDVTSLPAPHLVRHGRNLPFSEQLRHCLRKPIWNPQRTHLVAPSNCPVRNFYWVSPTIMRGGRPIEGFHVLKALGVRTVINLEDGWSSTKRSREAERKAGARYGIKVINTPLSPIFRLDKREVGAVLKLMAQPHRRPVFIHCRFGHERTGILVALDLIYNAGWCPRRAFRYMMDYGFRPYLVPALYYQFFTWSAGFCPHDKFDRREASLRRY